MSLKFPSDSPCDLINGLSLSDPGLVLVINEVYFSFSYLKIVKLPFLPFNFVKLNK